MMSRYNFLLFLLFLIITNNLYSQKIIDIEVDSIHCQDSSCFLLNFTEDQIYNCDFVSLELAEYRYQQAIDCSYDRRLNNEREKANTFTIKKITSLKNFKSWVSKLKFFVDFTNHERRYIEHFQSLSDTHGVIRQKIFYSENINKFKTKTKAYQIIPIRINKSYFIAGLINIDDYEVDHLIFPEFSSNDFMYYNNNIYRPTKDSFEIDPSIYEDIFRTFRVRTYGDNSILTNSISSHNLMKTVYDEILLEYPYIITKLNGLVSIYNIDLEKIHLSNLKEAYPCFGSVQVIINDEIKWLDSKGNLLDTMPKIERILDCGNVPCLSKQIIQHNNKFIEVVNDCGGLNLDEDRVFDSIPFNLNRDLVSIKFLNNKEHYIFSVDCFMQFFCWKSNYYFFQTKENTVGVFQRVNEKEELIEKIWFDRSLSSQEQRQKVKQIRDSLKTTFRDNIIYEGKYEEMILSGYNKPIIFKDKGLYGIFPFIQEAKFLNVQPFIGNLAKVIYKNGDTGWIDLNGKEIR